MTTNKLEQLKQMTVVVADTGDIDAIREFAPVDATTNPSLLFKAAQLPRYQSVVRGVVDWSKTQGGDINTQLINCSDRLAVDIGAEILKIIPGTISTEVDARASFDTQATLKKAYRLIELYEQSGISSDRILIKIASTWEGIRAAELLEREGIRCNLTLLFSLQQAMACADAGIYLISPFVGRILDWYKADTGRDHYPAAEDPGVVSVKEIFNYYKAHAYDTIVMGASFRNCEEIEQLAGCDRLTISPQLLEQLKQDNAPLIRKLDPARAEAATAKISLQENLFRWSLNENPMATEKLAEGIRNFAADQRKLETLLQQFWR
ncbi:transaldolase [Pseudomaricurvus alkylphenolicus]|jgi:transaldolase|uniref:transaldolase n=1 Tax=Pseudomaricurvus alkylphenolicus TaxID=1306991 RepID=UPI0014206CD1|nr:transaldolase [Pseudomaricurvus alkylphenolicus]NIB42393.1 transaldolase [Pseudomaricurvus alkylphenolicus]